MVEVHIAQYLLICQRHLNKIMNLLNTMMLNILFFLFGACLFEEKGQRSNEHFGELFMHTQCHQLVSLFS